VHASIVAAFFAVQPYILWSYVVAGALALIALLVAREAVSQSNGLDKIVALSPLCLAASLAAFGMEHLFLANFIKDGVPAWIPWHLFWAYFVGVALLSAALSIATNIQTRWSGMMLGIMIFLFVLMLHIPRVAANPRDRISWAVAFRDMSFAAGAWALAGTQTEEWREHGANKLITFARYVIAVAAIFFGVEHFMHPRHLPGVPLEKLTPAWVPGSVVIGIVTGLALVVAGICLLLAAKCSWVRLLGVWLVALVASIYLPMVISIPSAADGGAKIEGLNYFFDTLLYAGTVLTLAGALPKRSRES
jgi:uncharacterized membrane protein